MNWFKNHQYEGTFTEDVEEIASEKLSWIPFWRQLFVCSGVWSIYFVLGLYFGVPTVYINQMRKEANSTQVISDVMSSWLTSVHGYSALPWAMIIPVFSRYFGRKVPFMVVCFNTLAGNLVFYYSTTPTQLLISEIMQGILLGSNMTLLVTIVTEYSSPRYRGIFASIHASLFFLGVWVANVIGVFSHWRTICILTIVFTVFSASAFFWPESPCWLAMKGRFDDCAAAHRWLRGCDRKSEEELKHLIRSQKDFFKLQDNSLQKSFYLKIKATLKILLLKECYSPLLLSIVMLSLYHFSGKLVCSMYSLQLFNKITHNESTAYFGMLILEAVTIFGMYCGCLMTKFLYRRTIFFSTSILGVTLLFLISLYLYLINFTIINESKYVSISLLTIFSVTISCGPLAMISVIFGEITPLRYKSLNLMLITLYSEGLMATVLLFSPYIFNLIGLHGGFLFFGLSSSVLLLILYVYIPETKDKTLVEIEEYFAK